MLLGIECLRNISQRINSACSFITHGGHQLQVVASNSTRHGGLELARVDVVEVVYINAVCRQQRGELQYELVTMLRHVVDAGGGQHVLKIWVVRPRRRICHKVTVPKIPGKFAVNGAQGKDSAPHNAHEISSPNPIRTSGVTATANHTAQEARRCWAPSGVQTARRKSTA